MSHLLYSSPTFYWVCFFIYWFIETFYIHHLLHTLQKFSLILLVAFFVYDNFCQTEVSHFCVAKPVKNNLGSTAMGAAHAELWATKSLLLRATQSCLGSCAEMVDWEIIFWAVHIWPGWWCRWIKSKRSKQNCENLVCFQLFGGSFLNVWNHILTISKES